MRIERVQASAHKKGRVLVFLEDGACLKITEQEALDFGLRTGDDLDGRRLEQLKKAASVSNVKATAADLIGKRAMSRRDLERKLQEKGASQAEARYAAEWLEAIGAINDADYAAILVRHCAGLGYGPARIREKLREKGVPRELWDEALDQAPGPGPRGGGEAAAHQRTAAAGVCLGRRPGGMEPSGSGDSRRMSPVSQGVFPPGRHTGHRMAVMGCLLLQVGVSAQPHHGCHSLSNGTHMPAPPGPFCNNPSIGGLDRAI